MELKQRGEEDRTEHPGRDGTKMDKRASPEDGSRVQTAGLFLLLAWACAQLRVTEEGLPDVRG